MGCTSGLAWLLVPQYFAPVVCALLDPCIRAKQYVCYFEVVAGGGETFEAMLASLSAVLTLLSAHDVRINLSKCMFGFSKLQLRAYIANFSLIS